MTSRREEDDLELEAVGVAEEDRVVVGIIVVDPGGSTTSRPPFPGAAVVLARAISAQPSSTSTGPYRAALTAGSRTLSLRWLSDPAAARTVLPRYPLRSSATMPPEWPGPDRHSRIDAARWSGARSTERSSRSDGPL